MSLHTRIVLAFALLTRLNGAQPPNYLEQSYFERSYFEPNKGQAESSVRFLSRNDAYTQLFKLREVVWSFGAAPGASVSMSFAGARASSVTGLDRRAGKVNYLVGQGQDSWVTGIDCYARVRYQNIYPGIHAEFHRSDELFEYDFAIRPYARPSDLRLLFSGKTGAHGEAPCR